MIRSVRIAAFAVGLLSAGAAAAQPFCATNDNFNNCHYFTWQDCQRAARDMLPRGFCQRAAPRTPQPPSQQPGAQPASNGRTAPTPDFVVTRQAVINGRIATGAVSRG